MSGRGAFGFEARKRDEHAEGDLDALTGLPNGACLERRIEQHLGRLGKPFSLIAIDIDNFRSYNDAYGYAVGDAIIAQYGCFLSEVLAFDSNMVGRIGSEEYLAIIDSVDRNVLDDVANSVLAARLAIDDVVDFEGKLPVSLTASAGVASWDGESVLKPATLVRQAEAALRKAKQLGQSRRYAFETDDVEFARLHEDMQLSMELSIEIADALKHGEFEAFFQPLYSPSTGRVVGAEALARWRHPVRGLVSPAVFIPPLERNGSIVELDLAVFEQCCRFLRARLDRDKVIVPINCNFSRLHFLDSGFADKLMDIADRYSVPSSYLCAEITEGAFVEDYDSVVEQVERLHSHGFSVAMDDFGSGYSSFGSLQNLPIDEIKIDQLFFRRDLTDFRNATVVYSMANIAKVLGLAVVCEGIETAEQVEFLKGIGCDIAQGFYFSRPLDEAAFEELLERAQGGGAQGTFVLRVEDARSFIVRAFERFFIKQDFEAFAARCSESVQWQDQLEPGCFEGVDAVRGHFERSVRGREISLTYKGIAVNELSDDLIVLSGEAVLIGGEMQGSFYFGATCLLSGDDMMLAKMNIDRIIRSGMEAVKGPEMAHALTMGLERLDEAAALEPFYSMVPLGIVRYDLSGDMLITYMNQAMFDIIGYTKEQFYGEVGGNLRMVVHPDDLDDLYKKSVEMMEGGVGEPFVYRFIRRDGSIARVLYRQCNLPGIDGRPLTQGMYVNLDDVDRHAVGNGV